MIDTKFFESIKRYLINYQEAKFIKALSDLPYYKKIALITECNTYGCNLFMSLQQSLETTRL